MIRVDFEALWRRRSDPEAVAAMVQGIDRFIWKRVRWFCRRRPISEEDQEDMHGAAVLVVLEKVIPTWDPARSGFLTYGCYWIDHAIRRWWEDHKTAVRIPVHLQHYAKLKDRLATIDQASEKAPLLYSLAGYQLMLSLDVPAFAAEGSTVTFADLVPAPDQDPLALREAEDQTAELQRVLDQLKPDERNILLQRAEDKTLKEIGDAAGLSRERIRQIETVALAKMRALLAGEKPTKGGPRRRLGPPSLDAVNANGRRLPWLLRSILERRKMETLEAIGADLGLSRERVRQLEKIAVERVAVALDEKQPEPIATCSRFACAFLRGANSLCRTHARAAQQSSFEGTSV